MGDTRTDMTLAAVTAASEREVAAMRASVPGPARTLATLIDELEAALAQVTGDIATRIENAPGTAHARALGMLEERIRIAVRRAGR